MRILLGLASIDAGGGIASVSRSIVDALDRAVREGTVERVDVLTLLDTPPFSRPSPGGGRQIGCGGSQSRFAVRLWREIVRSRPDLVLFDHVGVARALFPRLPLPRPRTAIFVHGLELRGAEHDGRGRALRVADQILSNSEFTRVELSRSMPEIADRITAVPLCIEPARLEAFEVQSAALGEIVERRPAALIVGRMWSDQPGKGHDALIEAWPRVVERIPEAELWIAGGGDDVPRLEALARSSGVEAQVVFHGRVPDDELARLYHEASVFAMPSSQEGFGLVYLEAMWHGLPCIVSTCDAGQYVVDESTGARVEYGNAEQTADALIALLSDRERAGRMGEAARARVVEHFSTSGFAERLWSALEPGARVGDAREGRG